MTTCFEVPINAVQYTSVGFCVDDTPAENNKDTYRPPSKGSSSGSSGISTAPPAPIILPTPAPPPPSVLPTGLGWNAGAHSVESVPADWVGAITFDVPDILGGRPVGVAVGVAPVSRLPTTSRSSYAHITIGVLVFGDSMRMILNGAPAGVLGYTTIRAARASGSTTDEVVMLMYGGYVKVMVNGITVHSTAFELTEPYALDAVLYSAFDAVDNPLFTEGEWEYDEDGSLNALLPGLTMSGEGYQETSLNASLPGLAMKSSESNMAEVVAALSGLLGRGGDMDGGMPRLPGLVMRASQNRQAEVRGQFGLAMNSHLVAPDDLLNYAMVSAYMPALRMDMRTPIMISIDAALPQMSMRSSGETTYSEIIAGIGPLRAVAYSGEQTPLVQVVEYVWAIKFDFVDTVVGVGLIDTVQGESTALMVLVASVDASEQITAQDNAAVMQTFFDAVAEQVGVGERLRTTVFSAGSGALRDEGQAWVVNTDSNASTRYDAYGFNSFARVGAKHYGAKADGIYLLEGQDDAGQPIKSGVALGAHRFGTDALKHMDAVYAGVSSTGQLFIKVGDGKQAYTYRARRKDDFMKVQRFDVGRGLRANYFTLELTSEADAFELDSVTFNVLPTQRRI